LGSWKQHIPRSLRSFHLHSIKSRILAFALLATLIPSLTMGWLSYKHNSELLAEKTSGELRNITSHAAREIDIWLKERLYELRVLPAPTRFRRIWRRSCGSRGRRSAKAWRPVA